MDSAFDDLKTIFTEGILRVASSLLYLVIPFLAILILAMVFKLRGTAFKLVVLAGLIVGLLVFVNYGLPTVTG